MKTTFIDCGSAKIAVIYSREEIIRDLPSALDIVVGSCFENECSRVMINKEALADVFFKLETRIAGEVLQKFVNYNIKFAVYGDFSGYTSKALKDFIYECNNGPHICFADSFDQAKAFLCRADV